MTSSTPEAGPTNTIDFGSGDGAIPNDFAAPHSTAPPAVLPHTAHERTAASLPAGVTERGRWQQFAGSANGLGVSGNVAGAIDPSIVTDPAGNIYTAWSDARNGNFEIYVAQWMENAWQGLAGSDRHGGVSQTDGTSQQPSITINVAGQPLVTWMEDGNIFVSQFDPAASEWPGGMGLPWKFAERRW